MKTKVMRAIEPNQGVQKKFQKKLFSLQKEFQLMVMQDIAQALQDNALLALDAKPSGKSKMSPIAGAVSVSIFVSRFIKNNLTRWSKYIRAKAKTLASWFCRSVAGSTSQAQKQALALAGVPHLRIKKSFGIPVINRQYVSEKAAKNLPKYIDEVTNLISGISTGEVARLQDVLVSGLESGQSLEQIKNVLMTFKDFDAKRASRVALDQSTKINQQIQRDNAEGLGITHAVWVHVPGQYTSRQSHMRMNGKKFEINQGMYDPAVNKYVKPGELPYCRCIMRLVVDEDTLSA